MLELYHHNISVCAQKVRVVLAEKGLDWVGHHVDLVAGAQTEPAYLAVNPKGVVPALVDDGRIVTESTVICEYLDDAYPDPPLRPAQPHARSLIRLWARVPDDGIHVHCASVSFASAFARQLQAGFDEDALERRLDSMPDPRRAARQRQIMERGFDVPFVQDAVMAFVGMLGDMQAALEHGPWLAGQTFSLADACIAPYVERLDRLGLAPMWDGLPRVAAWYDALRARPSYDAAFTAFPPTGYDDLLRDRDDSAWPEVETAIAANRRSGGAA
ncbi:MAG: glutathione S-transferase family protein [Defluviicoccus sp.]|nr:glutathione S-transferase family protein [Defluviicoccus sp.]